MGAPTQVYVDPAINANSGTGTIGDPYGDLQYALNTVTRDATNGNQFNIKAGTDEVLTAALSLATYGTPTYTARLIFRGYTSAANDGGIGGISGAGSFSIFNSSTLDSIHFIDLHMHNCGANIIIRVDANCLIQNCEIDNCTGTSAIQVGNTCQIIRNKIHNCSQFGANVGANNIVVSNFFKNGANDFSRAIHAGNTGIVIEGNIISIDGSSVGIYMDGFNQWIKNNTIYSNAGTGTGILMNSGRGINSVINNVIVGFSGGGGTAINLVSGTNFLIYGNNKFYNNTTNETLSGNIDNDLGNNSALASSPFTNAAGDDFSVDTQLKAGAYPSSFRGASTNNYLDVGAAQRQEAAGGGPIFGGMVIR